MTENRTAISSLKRFGPLVLFILGYLLLRVFWIHADSGIPSVWEYGFHVTDEGYYLGAGKEKYLWGSFVDLIRKENLNYGYSAGTHWLSYFAHLAFGLSDWTWRIPFVIIYFLAWLFTFRFVEKRTSPLFALAVCLSVSSVPLVTVYERGASNDMLIGSLLMISYVIAAGRGVWRIFVSALVMGYIITIKPSVWAFFPIVLSGVFESAKFRSKLVDASVFVATSFLAIGAWYALMALSVVEQAREAGISMFEVLSRVHANYGLPSVGDIAKDFLAASTFPRDPTCRSLSAVAVLITVLPIALFLYNLLRRNWSGRMLLYFGIPLYVAGLTLINTQYTHYYLPMIVMLPAMFAAMSRDFAAVEADGVNWRRCCAELILIAGAIMVGVIFLASAKADIKLAGEVYSRIYNLPHKNVWTFTWKILFAVTAAGTVIVAIKRGFGAVKKESWAWAVAFFAVASVAMAIYPAYSIASLLRIPQGDFMAPIALSLVSGFLLTYIIFAVPGIFRFKLIVACIPVAVVAASYLAVPMWRSAAAELVKKGTFVQKNAAEELSALVPTDAVVLGERSNQVFMSHPVRTATTFIDNSNPFPIIEELRKRDPGVKLYALLDVQHSYMLGHFRKNQDKCRLELVKTVKMPSFANGALVDVHLCRLVFPGVQKSR